MIMNFRIIDMAANEMIFLENNITDSMIKKNSTEIGIYTSIAQQALHECVTKSG